MSGQSVHGVSGEEREDLSRAESAAIRRRSIRLLGELVRPVRGRVALAIAVIVVSTAAQVAGPALLALGIDRGLPAVVEDADWAPVAVIVAVYAVAAIVGAVLLSWFTVLMATLSQAVMLDLRLRVFAQTQRLSLDFHESYTSGRIISRQTSDLDSITELLDSGLNQLVGGVLFMAFTAGALILTDAPSALVILVALLPLAVLVRWFQLRSQAMFRLSRVASARLIVTFVETMTGIRAVKAFRAQRRNRDEFGDRVEDYRHVNARVIQLFGVFDPGLVLIGNVTVAAVLVAGGIRLVDGQLAIGALLAAVLYARRFFDPMEEMAMFYNSYQSAAAALEKISGVLEERPSVPEPSEPLRPETVRGELVFDRVRFGYGGGPDILPGIDLTIPAGQTVALVGSTGAGKTTLAKLLARFYDPVEGEVLLDGVPLSRLRGEELRRDVVMVTQEAYLFSGTVADNIALGRPDATRDEIVAAATAVGADPFIRALPDGYDSEVNKRGGRVSAGQRQLISFARAFVADPRVLILDEATASLDIPGEREVQRALQTLLADRTAVIIAHRLSTVAIADRVLVMERGRVVEDGTPAELIGGDGRFARLHAAWRESLV
ncbi:ABC transporter ATP-binding protein [Mycetocola reblochoni]|uniref:ABC transporter ATP-binding protein n=2 Tax=Mycetocola reblochoni TaxID=331618 RepID=A0A3L6ZMW8_9MICO|nr:ABC transporter ATP-binding protein [Mycetocola reblochoni]RLP69239.1 ABC transporter ATP-binding protein [Mycetocola reblochoni]SJN41574.1 Putative ABC iron siderophore transporter, fused permease and ATPase domains [Mycetocola reblochoni REB411]